MSRKPVVILVTDGVYDKGRAAFAEAGDDIVLVPAPSGEAALAEAVRSKGAFGVIVGVSPYTGPLYDALPRGGIIARFGVGHDGIDKQAVAAAGLWLTNTPGVLETSVAEQAVFLLGCLARNITFTDAAMRRGKWAPARGVELSGSTLSLIGFGRIARRVASIALNGLGMSVTACATSAAEKQKDFRASLSPRAAEAFFYTNSMEEALAAGRFCSLHLPLKDETRGIIGFDRLSLLPPGAFLVNTARGGLVDEDALYEALADGRLAGAAFDVFQNEPYSPLRPDRDLRTLPNMIMTPHDGSNTAAANERMARACLANIRALLEGRRQDMTTVTGG